MKYVDHFTIPASGYAYTGFPISRPGGNCIIVLASGHEDQGDKTYAEIGFIRSAYSGVDFHYDVLFFQKWSGGTITRLIGSSAMEGAGHKLVLFNASYVQLEVTLIGSASK